MMMSIEIKAAIQYRRFSDKLLPFGIPSYFFNIGMFSHDCLQLSINDEG